MPSDDLIDFWRERHLGTLTTLRADGSPHVVPVCVTVDETLEIARVTCSRGSVKARNVRRAAQEGARAAVTQVDGRRWSTLEGLAVVRDDAESVRDAEERFEVRYQRPPRVNPQRVVIEIAIDRVLGLR
ncbi:TIGR03618 family F420-dependent PPOX class oxidoreductase [Prauserella cavernicola]|uniref:TIGR03618 family F420-dependent PPOX class oxidoreductase n=1 Tax=Prauserella cavernicola TaxID=2800127 RepID=A0A934QN11_9PSEU|nr:TIGR03618 family F420-dependent PPOX class oxidoreductase [Prauserella cavernicola]MBK1782852.1 TIGR03618 family F420-dependent PPOX class oxidoreductase [Prauserella cavernicola]